MIDPEAFFHLVVAVGAGMLLLWLIMEDLDMGWDDE